MWIASRLLGSPDLHMVAVGILALVPLAGFVVAFTKPRLEAVRRLSARRVFPGTRVHVDLEVRNAGERRTPMLVVRDAVPGSLGSPQVRALGEVRGGARAHVGYDLIPRRRGRATIGPLTVWAADPFDLVRRRTDFEVKHDLVVFPEVEDLGRAPVAAPAGGAGESSVRQLHTTGEDFYTMRAYEEGDDLRRIHWPSVARSGELMIRQDEASRRATAAILVDSRVSSLGADADAFEHGVSAAASIGSRYLRAGYRLRVATADRPATPVDLDGFLETLALVRPTRKAQLAPALQRLGALTSGGGAVAVVTGLPSPEETAVLSRTAPAAGSRLAVLVLAVDPDTLPLAARREVDRRVQAARTSLRRSGWEVLLLPPTTRLSDVWTRTRRPATNLAASS